MKDRCPRGFVIAASGSGSGKTTLTLGLLEVLRRRGVVVQPFKAGPDYIDPGHHAAVVGRPSYNLDTWMMGADSVRSTFGNKAAGADVAVIEGVMGLFDGRGGGGDGEEDGSTAHLARVLGLPVLLVVNAGKTAGSIAAVIKGFESFDPGVTVRWVVFNCVGSARHYEMLKRAVETHTGVKVLGYLPRDERLSMPSRHLGLVTSGDMRRGEWKRFLGRAADLTDGFIDVEGLLRSTPKVKIRPLKRRVSVPGGRRVRIAVARDRAFCFYYQENLDILTSFGAELVYVSPLRAKKLPSGLKGLYIGGGYPELYAGELEENHRFREEVRRLSRAGMPIFAECGGLMYLGRTIRQKDGRSRSMTGVFPWSARMLTRRAALGYRELISLEGCPFLPEGELLRGHEYHYSLLSPSASGISQVLGILTGGGLETEGYIRKDSLATYIHIHFASNPSFASGFTRRCAIWTPG